MSELLITREITSKLARMIGTAVSHVLDNTDDLVSALRHVRTGHLDLFADRALVWEVGTG